MIIIRPLGVVAALLALPFCRPTRVLPRGQHAGAPSEAYRQLHNVIVQSRGEYTGELAPRLNIPAKKQHPRAEAPHSSPAAAKRALLGVRQTCDAGYGYCYGLLCSSRETLCSLLTPQPSIRSVLPQRQWQRPML